MNKHLVLFIYYIYSDWWLFLLVVWHQREFFGEKYQKFWIFGVISYLCGR